MKPLLYLFSRTFVNGIKRSFSSPARAIGTLFFLGYQLFFLSRFFMTFGFNAFDSFSRFHIPVPPIEIIGAFVFGILFLISTVWLTQMFSAPTGFQRADADVLFATPTSYRDILTFQISRSTILRFILPGIFAFMAWRPAFAYASNLAGNQAPPFVISSVLTTMTLVVYVNILLWNFLRYASVLSAAGTETKKEKFRVRAVWAVNMLAVTFIAVPGLLIFFDLKQHPGQILEAVVGTLSNRALWISSPIAGLSALATLGPMVHPFAAAGSVALLGGMSVVAIGLCYRYANRLCEFSQQSIAVHEKMRGRRNGEKRSSLSWPGKKTSSAPFLERLKVHGEAAFVWREALMTRRTRLPLMMICLIMNAVPVALLCYNGKFEYRDGLILGLLYMLNLSFGPIVFAEGSREMLKRTDLIRPLPVAPSRLMHMEVLSRVIVLTATLVPAIVIWVVMTPSETLSALTTLVLIMSEFYMSGTQTMLSTILLPDLDDPTQKGFRNLARAMTLIFTLFLMGGLYFAVFFVTKSIPLSSLIVAAASFGLGWIFNKFCGSAYQSFNPAD